MAAKALSFDVGDYVVYPKHGVGRVIELQSTDIAGMQLELYVLRFEKERMTLRVPTNKAESVGMRKLSSDKTMQEALRRRAAFSIVSGPRSGGSPDASSPRIERGSLRPRRPTILQTARWFPR